MSQRHSQRSGHTMASYNPSVPMRKERGKCTTFLCMSWKFFTCVFSHVMLVALVVSYCILGAYTFQSLEGENERQVKEGIPRIRENITEQIWEFTKENDYLRAENWTEAVIKKLQDFEIKILDAMKMDGWDGSEQMDQMQWTFAGSLFYSIIVITTIGYGHIAPKTSYGKVTTIFYAILGIPLMLLCLSNIGDIMASSFRFLYWRVCCFVCTREPKRPRRARSIRGGTVRQGSGRPALRGSMRRPERFSQKSYDSGIVPWTEPAMAHAYSDTDLRYSFMERSNYHLPDIEARGTSRQPQRISRDQKDRFRDRHTVERERNVGRTNRYEEDTVSPQRKYNTTGRLNRDSQTPKSRRNSRSIGGVRSQSLDRKARKETPDVDFDQNSPTDSNVFINKYAIDEMQRSPNRQRHSNRDRFQNRIRQNHNRSQSVPRPVVAGNQLELPSPSPPRRTQSSYSQYSQYDDAEEEGDMELQPIRRSPRKKQREALPPSPRIMSPLGFQTHRQARYEDLPFYDDDPDYYDLPPRSRPVPIWLCVFLVVSYIIAGAFIFSAWENWSLLDSAYFCFITLTTIGFGDFVPAQGVKTGSEASIAQCSLYLLFGIALLAMSFNLVQEEVIANVKGIARRLGILKEEEIND